MALALQALVAILQTDRLRDRLIDLTGLTPDHLREGVDDPAVMAAVVGFLEGFEPDLIQISGQIGVSPEVLVKARRVLLPSQDLD